MKIYVFGSKVYSCLGLLLSYETFHLFFFTNLVNIASLCMCFCVFYFTFLPRQQGKIGNKAACFMIITFTAPISPF